MCRWFAYISTTEPCLLEDVLILPKHSLVKQINDHYLPKLIDHDPGEQTHDQTILARNCLNNIDGFGVLWYTSANADFERGDSGESGDGTQKEGLRPAAYKMSSPPVNDLNFRSICANTETTVCFAHVRAAVGSPTMLFNNHPFIFGRHSFMHNGTVSDFVQIKRPLLHVLSDAAYRNINGSTDSEHVAALYMTHLTSGGDESSFEQVYSGEEMANALLQAISDVVNMQRDVLGDKACPDSLNLCVTDGIKLVACRFRNHKIQQPPSLYYSTKAGVTLNRKYPDNADGVPQPDRVAPRKPYQHGPHLIVASEPSTYVESDWELFGKNQYLIAENTELAIRDIPWPDEWNAEDSTPIGP